MTPMGPLRRTVALLAAYLLISCVAAAPRAGQGRRSEVWVNGLGIRVTRDCSVYIAPSTRSKVLEKAYVQEILSSVGGAPKGWFRVYCQYNTRGYIQAKDVERFYERDRHGKLKDAWVDSHHVLSDYYAS